MSWRDVPSSGGQTATVDGTHVLRGALALRLHVDPLDPGSAARVQLIEGAVVPQPSLFVRAFAYLPSSLQGFNVQLLALTQSGMGTLAVGTHDGTGAVLLSSTNRTWNPEGTSIGSFFPFDRWVCIEWEMEKGVASDGGTGAGSTRIWLDDALVSDVQPMLPNTRPWFAALAVGVEVHNNQAAPAFDVWLDEIALSSQRITCAK